MTITANEVFRDYETDGVPASGDHQINKADAREWGTGLEATISVSYAGVPFTVGDLLYASDTNEIDAVVGVATGQPLISKGVGVKPDYAGGWVKFDAGNTRLILSRNSTAWAPAGTTGLAVQGADTGEARLEVGPAANADAVIVLGRLNNTYAAPEAIESGNQIVGIIGTGIDTDGSTTMQQGGYIGGYASQDWTGIHHGFEWRVGFIKNNETGITDAILVGGAAGNYVSFYGQFGYVTGASAGGAVTQATSRTTAVTLNKPTGAITLVSAAGSGSLQTFTVNNSTVAATDVIIAHQKSGTDKYSVTVTRVAAGAFDLSFYTFSGTTVEQPVFNFAVIKGSAN